MRSRRIGTGLLVIGVAALLAGCGIGDVVNPKPKPACPGAVIVHDLSHMTVFQPGSGRDITDVMYEAQLPRIKLGCDYKDNEAVVNTAITITAARGPANRNRSADVRYFVAILDGKNKIIAKREFESHLRFPPNVDRGATTDELVQRIPLKKGEKSAGDHVIVVGFQLSRAELAFNRNHGQAGLLGPVPPRPEAPRTETGGIDNRPLYEQSDNSPKSLGPPK